VIAKHFSRLALLALVFAAACQSKPLHELALADVAIRAAQRVKADALAPDTYRRAENHYLRAKRDYQEGYYDSSRRFADDARRLAEQAEYQALLKQLRTRTGGDAGAGAASPGASDLEKTFSEGK